MSTTSDVLNAGRDNRQEQPITNDQTEASRGSRNNSECCSSGARNSERENVGATEMWFKRVRENEQQKENLQEQPREKEECQESLQEQLRDKEQQQVNLEEQLREKDQEKTNLEEKLREKEERQGSLQEQLREKEQQKANLEKQLRQKDQQKTNLEEQLREKEQLRANLEEQLREKEQQRINLEEQLGEKDQEKTNLEEQLIEKEERQGTLQEQLIEKEREKTNLEEQLREQEERQERSHEQLREKEGHEANLQGQLRRKEEEVHELTTTLSTIRQLLNEQQQQQARDWVINRDEIDLTDNSLGSGGWGTVVQGKFRGCKVAVKQIHQLILSPHNRRLFEREMNIASRCRHPCLLQFVGATNDDGNPLFVTELMDCSLRALLEQRTLSQAETSIISSDVAQALNYLHLNRPSPIIHRDISSANVLLWKQGDQWRGKVSDYGTANFMRHTMTVAPGAVIYSAPEAFTSAQTVKVDVYSFGVLLCEMCIRELPEPQRREEQVARVETQQLRNLVRRCIQREPAERPTMEQIIGELEAGLERILESYL